MGTCLFFLQELAQSMKDEKSRFVILQTTGQLLSIFTNFIDYTQYSQGVIDKPCGMLRGGVCQMTILQHKPF